MSRETYPFVLNTGRLKIDYSDKWAIFEINCQNWDDKYFDRIIEIRRNFAHEKYMLESRGRILIGIPSCEQGDIDWRTERKQIVDALQSKFDSEVTLDSVSLDYLFSMGENAILPIKEAIGGIIGGKLKEMGFEKVSSKGSVGRFFHPEYCRKKVVEAGRVSLRHLIEFVLTVNYKSGGQAFESFLSIDVKTEVSGSETLLDLLGNKKGEREIKYWPKDQWRWEIKDNIISNTNRKKAYQLVEIEDFRDGEDKPLNLVPYGKMKKATVRQFLNSKRLRPEKNDIIAVLKDKSKQSRDPNVEYRLPASLLEHSVTNSSVKGREWERDFHNFSKLKPRDRVIIIGRLFDYLKQKGIVEYPKKLKGSVPSIAHPTVGRRQESAFEKRINVVDMGVEEWGFLKKIKIYHTERDRSRASSLNGVFRDIFEQMRKRSKISIPDIEMERYSSSRDIKHIAFEKEERPEETLHLFIGFREEDYRNVKTWFTHQNRKPVQFVQPGNIGCRRYPLVKTLIPQMIAKTGGFPYKLDPPLLDRALIIGLDKARDSSSTRPSASAGVAAVSPEGRYVSAASTPLDTSKHDRIDVDVLAPKILENIEEYQKKLDYVVILRDGAPSICRSEVAPWKKHLSSYGLDLVFMASRKQNPYRVFPELSDRGAGHRLRLPAVIDGAPLSQDDFLVVTTNPPQGTARPVLYTLLENDAGFSREEIKTKVVAQVVSMSKLCWESPLATSQPLPLHYADKLAAFTQVTQHPWVSSNRYPMFI